MMSAVGELGGQDWLPLAIRTSTKAVYDGAVAFLDEETHEEAAC
jgi:hypothetical protein